MTLPSSGPLSLSDIQGEFGGSNPIGMNEYYAGGGLVPSGTTGTYGAVPTSGQISVQNFYGTSNYVPTYIEDLFSTWLYTGNGATQTITNGINLSGSGGLVWIKGRNGSFAPDHLLYDTSRGVTNGLVTNSSGATYTNASTLTAFTSSGFSVGNYVYINNPSGSFGSTYISWTFRKQPKFFDIVTYTGNGVSGRQISHNLGCVPGAIIIKNTSSSTNWAFALATDLNNWSGTSKLLCLNTTDQDYAGNTYSNGFINDATSTTFQVVAFSGNQLNVNQSGETYVAYLFASNAGGFGPTGTDNVITCGSVTGSQVVNLGYEPQWVLSKCAGSAGQDWTIVDNMRGAPTPASGYTPYSSNLMPNLSNTESTTGVYGASVIFNSTGFRLNPNTTVATTYIYIAIRRGPMKVPTVGTSVFAPVYQAGGGTVTTNFRVDATITKDVAVAAVGDNFVWDRLRGSANGSLQANNLKTNSTAAESSGSFSAAVMNVSNVAVTDSFYGSGYNISYLNFQRAPGFFDEVCYSGDGVNRTIAHNLGVVPELMIVKGRTGGATEWTVYNQTIGNTEGLRLNSDIAASGRPTAWNNTSPTASVFTVGTSSDVNNSSLVYVAYLFATCPGVSKVGSYTGTGALQTINCGFTSGARFVLIKRTDSTGDWYVWDSARGISSGNDPYFLWDTDSAQVTGTNYVDTTSVGFQVTAAAPSGINASGGTYIFLAIA